MDVSLFDYELPPELIAQHPAERRDASRLLVVRRETGELEHRAFPDLAEYLRPGDCLVVNDTKVLPARLLGRLPTGGAVELLLLRPLESGRWETLGRPGRKLRPGTRVEFDDPALAATVTRLLPDGLREVKLTVEGELHAVLERVGHMPLPPYIRRPDEPSDRARYQTVFAQHPGAVAAPTAGLHFTPEYMQQLESRGVTVTRITLHVGLATFRPVEAERVEDHVMHAEAYHVSPAAATAINAARDRGGRVIAVGTTVTRTLETVAEQDACVAPGHGASELFIFPGHRFQCVQGLVTNFHLPRSTLLMLVSAFGGRELVLRAYEEAVRQGYRFYSYGDAMLVL